MMLSTSIHSIVSNASSASPPPPLPSRPLPSYLGDVFGFWRNPIDLVLE